MKGWLVLPLAAGLALPPPVMATRAAPACTLPARFVTSEQPMPALAKRLRPGGSLAILAIGSAGSFAPGANGRRSGFPSRMLAALGSRVPGAKISLLLAGGSGLTARQMVPILEHALASREIGLVVWQTGTVEAVKDSPPEDLLAALAAGVSIVQEAGADLILIDPMFSRFLTTDTNIDAYLPAFREVAIEPEVSLFPRFALTRYWVDQGSFDLESQPPSALPALAGSMQDCLGQALARFVLSAAGIAAAPHE